MPEENVASVLSTVALISLVISGVMFLFALASVIRRIRSKKKKRSGLGVFCVILATLSAVISFQLYVGTSIWFLLGIAIVDSIFILLLT